MHIALSGVLLGAAPVVGDVAPDFRAQDTEGRSYHLDEMVRLGPVVIAFFPRAFTPG